MGNAHPSTVWTKKETVNLNLGYIGLQLAFGIESANLSRIFQQLGAQTDRLALLWLAAPVAGLIIQPLIGVLSDRSASRFGQRRPYMLASTLFVIAALALLPLSRSIGWALLAVWCLEIFMNALNAPYRALVSDTLPLERRAGGFTMQTVFIGSGACLGGFAARLLSVMGLSGAPAMGHATSSMTVCFAIAAAGVALCMGWTLFHVSEPARPVPEQRDKATTRPSLARIGWQLRGLAIVQFFTWFGFYMLWVYAAPHVAGQVFGARSPLDPLYALGADWAGVMFGIYNAVAALFSLALPRIFARFGLARLHAVALLASAAGFLGLAWATAPVVLVLSACLIGIGYASTVSTPFGMACRVTPPEVAGSMVGVMNIFIVLPQIIAGLSMGWVLRHILHGRLDAVFALAAACTGVAAILAWLMRNMAGTTV